MPQKEKLDSKWTVLDKKEKKHVFELRGWELNVYCLLSVEYNLYYIHKTVLEMAILNIIQEVYYLFVRINY